MKFKNQDIKQFYEKYKDKKDIKMVINFLNTEYHNVSYEQALVLAKNWQRKEHNKDILEKPYMFSGHIDLSKGGFLKPINPEIVSKRKNISTKERYNKALHTLREITNIPNAKEIIIYLEQKEKLSVEERMNLRFIK